MCVGLPAVLSVCCREMPSHSSGSRETNALHARHIHTQIYTQECAHSTEYRHTHFILCSLLCTRTLMHKKTHKKHKGGRSDTYTSSVSPQACWAPASAEIERETKTEKTNVTINMILTFKADHLKRVSCNFNRFFQIKNLLMFLMNN